VTPRRAADAALALLFAAPLASLWTEPTASPTLKLLVAAVLGLTAVRPAMGLCLVAALLPISPALHMTMPAGAIAREAQALVLALLAAGHARLAFTPPGPPSRLALPALALGLVIAARDAIFTSGDLVELPLAPAAGRVWTYVTREYFAPNEVLPDLHRAMAWIAALALAVFVERLIRRDRATAEPAVRLAIVGAAAAAAFTIFRAGEMVWASGGGWDALLRLIRDYRFNPFLADLNAAGSSLLLSLIPAVWMAVTRRAAWAWTASILISGALWFTGSRAAVIAAFGGALAAWVLARRMPRRWWAAVAVVVIGVTALGVWSGRPRRATVSEALTIRWHLGVVSLQAAATDPLLGIGVDRLRTASAPFIPPELARLWRPAANGENAHNNFLQILAESGVLGLAAFLWLLAASVGRVSRWRPDAASDAMRPGIVGGLAAFLLTSLAGHPLLVEIVRLSFFFWIGCVAAGTSPAAARRWPAVMTAALAVLLVILLPPRVATARRVAGSEGVMAGAAPVAGRVDGVPYRPAGRDSEWTIDAATTTTIWKLRADFGSPSPCRVEIEVDGRLGMTMDLDDRAWRPIELVLAPPPTSQTRGLSDPRGALAAPVPQTGAGARLTVYLNRAPAPFACGLLC
jgi:hypothetical protein